jgi:transcriptional regulator with XRE-family HTH domain
VAAVANNTAQANMLGAYIRAQREMAHLSLRQMAELSNVSNAYLSQIERGLHQPSVAVIMSIATALQLSGETLLAQAGLIDPGAATTKPEPGVEAAILADSKLTDDEKDVLVGVYRNFSQRHDKPATE